MAAIPATYKAYTYERWGPVEEVLKLTDVQTSALSPSYVRIQVHSVALNPADYKVAESNRLIFTTTPPSVETPYRIGFDVAGVVVEVGSDSAQFQVGDEVYAMASIQAWGSLTEYLSLDAQLVAHKPTSLDFDHAAGVPLVSLTSFQAITHHAQTQPGERVLILGGSSATGIFAVQYAKSIGAYVVATASQKNAAFVKSLGADHVIDYTTKQWSNVLDNHSVDVIYDCVGEPNAWRDGAQRTLKKETGRFVTIAGGPQTSDATYGASYKSILTNPNGKDLSAITEMIERGEIKSVIDSVFPFGKAVEAFTRLKTGRAVGKVVVQVQSKQVQDERP